MASRDSPTKYKLFLKMYWNEKMYKASKDSSKPAEAPAKLSEVREACVDSNTRKSSGREHQSKMTDVSRMAFTCAAMLENKGHNRGKCISEKALFTPMQNGQPVKHKITHKYRKCCSLNLLAWGNMHTSTLMEEASYFDTTKHWSAYLPSLWHLPPND